MGEAEDYFGSRCGFKILSFALDCARLMEVWWEQASVVLSVVLLSRGFLQRIHILKLKPVFYPLKIHLFLLKK